MALVRCTLALILCVSLAACERIPTNPDSGAPLSIQVRLPAGWQAETAQTVSVLAVRVSGPHMPPVVVKARLISDSTITRAVVDTVTVFVPIGPERFFEVFLLEFIDAAVPDVKAYADTVVDIPRGTEPVRLSLALGPPPPPPLVRIITSHALPGSRDTAAFFTEWVETQVKPLGYRVEYQRVGFDTTGADLMVIPMPNADFPYSSKEGDMIMHYLQVGGGSALFLGDVDFGGDMTMFTNRYGFYFVGTVTDTLQFESVWEAPLVTNFGAVSFLTSGDTLVYAGGVSCTRFDTLIDVAIDTVAKLSEGGFAASDVIRFGPPAVALYGRINGGQFVAVGDMDWIGPTGLINVGGGNTLITTGLQVKQHHKLARLVLQRLAPPNFLDIP